MVRFLKALVLVPVALAVVLLAIANRAPVTLSFDPFSDPPEFQTTQPLFAVIFAAVMLGLVIGGIAAWLAQGRNRRERRTSRREAVQLKGETDRLRSRAAASSVPALTSSRGSSL